MDTEALTAATEIEVDRAALLPVYVAESEENLAALEEALLALEESPDDGELLATIFRAAHTLKGNSESLGVAAMTACAHAVESVLDGLRSGALEAASGLVSVLLDAIDAMRTLVGVFAGGGAPSLADHAALMTRLADVLRGGLASADAASRAILPAAASRDAVRRKTLRVDLPALDRIVTHLEELAIARAHLRVSLERERASASTLDALEETESHFDDLRERIMRLRLVPIRPAFRAQTRTVRDLGPAHGKKARLVIEGDDVEVETTVLEGLKGPITHMVRNAVDHGIELPDVRRASGKDPVGTIALSARHESGRLVVCVSDDGAGFRRDRIITRARELGLVGSEASSLTDREVFKLVFARGFSTAETVTDLSGRGVGMDIVEHEVAAMNGQIEVSSTEGVGTAITLRVPLTLSIVEGFTVGAAGESYVIPLQSVRECIELPSGATRFDGDAPCGVLMLRGGPLPFVRLRDLFRLGGSLPIARENVVVVEHQGRMAGLAVDTLRGRGQVVVKPLAGLLQESDVFSGTTLLGDGRVALILDVAALLRDVARRQRTGSPVAQKGRP